MPSEHDFTYVEGDSFPPWTDMLRGFVLAGMLIAGFIGIESWVIDVIALTTTTISSEHGFIYIEDDSFPSWTKILRGLVLGGMLNAGFIGTTVVLFIMGGLVRMMWVVLEYNSRRHVRLRVLMCLSFCLLWMLGVNVWWYEGSKGGEKWVVYGGASCWAMFFFFAVILPDLVQLAYVDFERNFRIVGNAQTASGIPDYDDAYGGLPRNYLPPPWLIHCVLWTRLVIYCNEGDLPSAWEVYALVALFIGNVISIPDSKIVQLGITASSGAQPDINAT
ncbi:hypothetical protein AZE42_06296 [Rhizopogon vesiculosus]|uniref:Uncharacterized protein n=1 Tax=Rhizopogon vesiculosus TaxID=180088 RepID=A0A1J8Q9Y4_9AGAM|nr:hypothetical protein AZE42_06296 [Rhizopogon vesiculosus]